MLSEYLTTLQKKWLLTVAQHVKMTNDELARIREEEVLASFKFTTRLHSTFSTAIYISSVLNALHTQKCCANLSGNWLEIIPTYCLLLRRNASSAAQHVSKRLCRQSRLTLLKESLLFHYHRGLFSRQMLLPYFFESV